MSQPIWWLFCFYFPHNEMDGKTVAAKYKDIIAEEVNVKDVYLLDDAVVVTTTYVPLGQKLGAVFGKDTSLIISSAKQ